VTTHVETIPGGPPPAAPPPHVEMTPPPPGSVGLGLGMRF
jgi:hypothetical protein